jgi:hypothetical protein
MSTSAISSISMHQKLDVYFGVRHHELRKLEQALESGDLANAQQDYADIRNLGQRGPFPSGNAFWNSDRQQDFEAIGSALQSGDLAGAQQAFQQLTSTFKHKDPSTHQPTEVASGGDPASGTAATARSVNINA